MPLTPEQWSLVGSHYGLAIDRARKAIPPTLRGDVWLEETAVDGAITRLRSLAKNFDPGRDNAFSTYAHQSLYLAAKTRINAEMRRREKLRHTRIPCTSRFVQFGEPQEPTLDSQEMTDRMLHFAGTPDAAEILKRHCIEGEPLRAVARAFGYCLSYTFKIKNRSLEEIRAALHAGLIGATT